MFVFRYSYSEKDSWIYDLEKRNDETKPMHISGHLFAALQSNGINAISTAKNTRRHKLHFRDRDLRHIDAYVGQGQLTQKTKMLVHLISACPGTASFVSNLLGTRTDNVGAKSLCVENDVPR